MSKKERIMLHLNAKLNCFFELTDKKETELKIDRCTMLVGDGTYNGVFFPCEEIEKAFMSFEGKPININHNAETVEDIVGFLKNVEFDDGKLTATPVFDKDTVKHDAVMGYMSSRFKAGDIPNVSVGVWLNREIEENEETKEKRYVARELEGDHLAVVVHGACNPQDGCGIGIGLNNDITISHDEYVADDEAYERMKLMVEIEKTKLEEEK